MPERTSTRFTVAQADASARVPNSITSAQTSTPTIHAVRKQPRRKTASAPAPIRSGLKSKAHQASPARRAKTTSPRAMPTSQEPSVRCRTAIGARNWCFIDLLQTS